MNTEQPVHNEHPRAGERPTTWSDEFGGVIDLSQPIRAGMRTYPGDPPVGIERVASIELEGADVHALHLGSHSGTHVDAPSHMILGGRTIDAVLLDRLVGRAAVLRVRGLADRERITTEHVAEGLAHLDGVRVVLIDTGWDAHFGDDRSLRHPVVSVELADALIDAGVDVLGVDTLSPDATLQPGASAVFPVHERFLGTDRLIIENLRGLDRIRGDRCWFVALPLPLAGVDGSPVRAVARPLGPAERLSD